MDDGAAPEGARAGAGGEEGGLSEDAMDLRSGGDVLSDDLEANEDEDEEIIERAVLNESEEGREIAASFVKLFADFFATSVRPILVQVAEDGRHPQLLVNGLAELMRTTADRIEFPLDHPRAGTPK